jgi:phage baseplate assembly protein V
MSQYEGLRRLIDPLERRVRALVMRATVTRVDDGEDLQQLQVSRLEGEVLEGCERVGQYGLTSVPPAGAEAIVVQIGSNADHQVILGVDDKSRPHPLQPGQTVLYDGAGTRVILFANGNVGIVASGTVTIQAPSVALSGNLFVAGDVTIAGSLNGHTP